MGCGATLEVMERGAGHLPPPTHPPARLWIWVCTPCWGWWRAQLGRQPLASHASSPSLEHAFLWAQGVLGWLWLPGSSRAMVEPAFSPSIILISRRWQPGGPWQRGCTDGGPGPCGERQAGGIVAISHAANKNNNSPPRGLQSAELKFMWPQRPAWVLGGGGQPRMGTGAGHGAGTTWRCGSDKVSHRM